MKIINNIKYIFILLILSGLYFLNSCSKPVEMCDTPDLSCITFMQEVFGYFPETSCPANVVLKPGDTITFLIYSTAFMAGTSVKGCSSNPWTLTATPPAGVTVFISKNSPPGCADTDVLLAQSAAPGLSASISGPAGCMAGKGESIGVVGGGAIGTVSIDFN